MKYLRIGDFSNVVGISVKTIRFYEEKGLIKPAYIDKYTGYRYYDEKNIEQILMILQYKNMGFTLEEIKNINPNQLISKVAVTDADGNTKITTDDSYFVATSGNNLSNEEYLYKSHTQYNSPHISGKCFTDLAIYHPGDSLKFSAVIYQTENNKHKLYTNKTIISIQIYAFRRKKLFLLFCKWILPFNWKINLW